jgi:CDP-diacylglycerol--glycerol-3-phosphate 3-phosphatidyltransferase
VNAVRRNHHRRWTAANCITAFRLLVAAPALAVFALAGWREGFVWMLVASFASDLLDGTVARLSGGGTRFGARLDSWADGAAYCAISLGVPLLWPRLLAREWPAMLAIMASFVLPGVIGYLKFRRFTSYHTLLVKAAVGTTALALMSALWGGPLWPLHIAALLAVAAAVEEIAITWVLRAPLSNVGGIVRVWRERHAPPH